MKQTSRLLGIGLIVSGLLWTSVTAGAGTIQTSFCSAGTPVSAWAPIAGDSTPGYLLTVPASTTFLLTQVCSAVGSNKFGFSIETADCFPAAGCTMTVEVAGGPLKNGGAGANSRCVSYDPGVVFAAGSVIQARDNNNVAPGGAKVTIMGLNCP